MTTSPAPVPKNGTHLVCLVAGGAGDIARKIIDRLQQSYRIEAAYHWAVDSHALAHYTIPKCVDFVLIVKSYISHKQHDRAKVAAKRAGIPIVVSTDHWVDIAGALRRRWGFVNLAPLKPGRKPKVKTKPVDLPALRPAEPAPAPEPEPTPPPPPEPVPSLELRARFLDLDTAELVQEIQARMQRFGLRQILIGPAEITIETAPKK